MALEPSRMAEYRIGDPLGSGATARVFEAQHIATGRQVAIKMLEPTATSSPELQERLAREAIMLSGVSSRHVGRILGFGYEKDMPFLVLERLRGETLDHYLKREGLPKTEPFVEWIEQLLMGLRDCHRANVIHRDVKPANIFLMTADDGSTMVKLIDFGVARLREIANVGEGLTLTHHVIGSMGYMAPEQFEDAKGVGPPADLYAVGCVVYRGFTGRLPFMHKSLEAVIKMKREHDPPPLSAIPGIVASPSLERFVQRALAREPERRYQSAREMLEDWYRASSTLENIAPMDEMVIEFEEEEDSEAAIRTLTLAGNAAAEDREFKTVADGIAALVDPYGAAARRKASSAPPRANTIVDDTLPTDNGNESTIRRHAGWRHEEAPPSEPEKK